MPLKALMLTRQKSFIKCYQDLLFFFFFFLLIRRPPRSPFFPYPPLFQSFAPAARLHPQAGLFGLAADDELLALLCLSHDSGLRRAAAAAAATGPAAARTGEPERDRKSTRLNSSHLVISYAVFCLKKK